MRGSPQEDRLKQTTKQIHSGSGERKEKPGKGTGTRGEDQRGVREGGQSEGKLFEEIRVRKRA